MGLLAGATFALVAPGLHGPSVWVSAFLMPYGMTMTGYEFFMWPLAYANHRLVSRLA